MRNCLILAALVLFSGSIAAQAPGDFPSRPIRIVIPFGAGGIFDAISRRIGDHLHRKLGQPVVVEYKPGAGTIIGVDFVAKAAPDGYTLLLTNPAAITQMQFVQKSMPFDAAKDLAPVTRVADVPTVLVTPSNLPVTTARELASYLKANPGVTSFGSYGNASTTHLYGEAFKRAAKADSVHIAYKGAAQADADLMSGRITYFFANPGAAVNLMKQGKVHGLGVTGTRRLPAAAHVPTLAEAGFPGFEEIGWFSIFAPSHTPTEILRLLHAEISAAVKSSDMETLLRKFGMSASGIGLEELAASITAERATWGRLIRDYGIRVD